MPRLAIAGCLLPLALCGCEYVAGLGLFAAEYRKEQRVQERKLDECGECGDGERCNLLMDPSECRPIGGLEGDPCGAWMDRVTPEHQFDCDPPLSCNEALEPDVCTLPGPDGSACTHGAHCLQSSWCDEYVCVPTLAIAAECSDHEACRPNVCFFNGTARTCEPAHAVGEACTNALDCASGLACDRGRCIVLPD